jgi:hypothetical protein
MIQNDQLIDVTQVSPANKNRPNAYPYVHTYLVKIGYICRADIQHNS